MKHTKKFTCIICPVGCELSVDTDDGEISNISGYSCRRGEKYARGETLNPVRTFTGTVHVSGGTGKLLPVKSDRPIRKSLLFEAISMINTYEAAAPIHMGDILIRDFAEPGVNLVAGRDVL